MANKIVKDEWRRVKRTITIKMETAEDFYVQTRTIDARPNWAQENANKIKDGIMSLGFGKVFNIVAEGVDTVKELEDWDVENLKEIEAKRKGKEGAE